MGSRSFTDFFSWKMDQIRGAPQSGKLRDSSWNINRGQITGINGASRWISKSNVVDGIDAFGEGLFYLGAFIDGYNLMFEGQPLGETILKVGMSAFGTWGGLPGLMVSTPYFILGANGAFEYEVPLVQPFAISDATNTTISIPSKKSTFNPTNPQLRPLINR